MSEPRIEVRYGLLTQTPEQRVDWLDLGPPPTKWQLLLGEVLEMAWQVGNVIYYAIWVLLFVVPFLLVLGWQP